MALILVVEDDVAMREGIGDILELEGHEVRRAANGEAALRLMETFSPDLILSDIMMPVMDGYRFYQQVRKRPHWLAIPFIFLTAKDQKADVRMGKRLGADDYLTKPFDREDLLIAVTTKLRRAAELQQASQEKVAQLEQQLVRSERLATIGQLATEFAHEIKNPLTAISMYAQFAQQDLSDVVPNLAQDMEQIVHQSERIAQLAQRLLGFSRQMPHMLQGVDVAKLLDRVVDLVQFRLTDITVAREYEPGLPSIQADPGQLEQVFLNLIVNAVQAMPEGGQLTLGTGKGGLPHLSGAPGVWVTIADTGCGISAEHQARLFEAYFTTKEAGEGTGLGLYVCKNIIQSHGGVIEVASREGVGSTFTLYLPLIAPQEREKHGST